MNNNFNIKPLFPQLRFPEFKDPWQKKQLSEVGTVVSGLTYKPSDVVDDGILVLRSSNIRKAKLSFKDNVYVNPKTVSFNAVMESDILICVRNGSKRLIGKNALVDKNAEGSAFGAFMSVFRSESNKFIFQLFNSDTYKKQVHRNLGATINSINGSDLKKFTFGFPSKDEQEKIASFLASVDNWIENLEKQKNSLEEYKKGIMQKIFSQEIRFKDKNGCEYPEWKKIKLRKLSKVITKGTTPTSLGFSYLKEGVNFIKAENINQYSEISISETMKVSSECNQALSRSSLEENDILFSIAGTLGRTAIVKKKDLPANTNQALAVIRLNSTVDVFFIEKFLNSQMIEKYILQMLSVGAQPNLSLKQVGNIEVNLPSIKEQMQIASFLFSIENLVESKSKQITKAKEWKKGLLQQMFV